jgi:hypothetical protein
MVRNLDGTGANGREVSDFLGKDPPGSLENNLLVVLRQLTNNLCSRVSIMNRAIGQRTDSKARGAHVRAHIWASVWTILGPR